MHLLDGNLGTFDRTLNLYQPKGTLSIPLFTSKASDTASFQQSLRDSSSRSSFHYMGTTYPAEALNLIVSETIPR
jgi:hypothetical protein